MAYKSYEVDNRDAGQMYEYMEARIEFMKRRIVELERENQTLRLKSNPERRELAELSKTA
jgi:hypothetical protein